MGAQVSGIKYLEFIKFGLVTKSTITCDERNNKHIPLENPTGHAQRQGGRRGSNPQAS